MALPVSFKHSRSDWFPPIGNRSEFDKALSEHRSRLEGRAREKFPIAYGAKRDSASSNDTTRLRNRPRLKRMPPDSFRAGALTQPAGPEAFSGAQIQVARPALARSAALPGPRTPTKSRQVISGSRKGSPGFALGARCKMGVIIWPALDRRLGGEGCGRQAFDETRGRTIRCTSTKTP